MPKLSYINVDFYKYTIFTKLNIGFITPTEYVRLKFDQSFFLSYIFSINI